MHIEFIWFTGVVEDRLDPLKLGRVKIRILGQHTEDKQEIPTEDLPWAYPMQPITSAAMNGLGSTPVGPVEGTWVVGFYRDGTDCQEPIIMGTLAGIPSEYPYPKSKTVGFLDPREDHTSRPRKYKIKEFPNDGTGAILEQEEPSPPSGESYPRRLHPFGSVVGESDVNRLLRNEQIADTIVQNKRDFRDLQVPTAEGDLWDEPETPYDASYPYNHVYESESGHIIEIDDTVNNERLHTYHKSGTFSEIYADGVKVEKVVGNNYKIVLEEQYEHVQNRYNLTIDGPFNVFVRNNCKVVVTGNAEIEVGGDMTTTVGGDYTLDVVGDINIRSTNNTTVQGNLTTVIGAGNLVSLRANAVTSNPPISHALLAGTAGGLGVFIPTPPMQMGVSVSSPNSSVLLRDYPRPLGSYIPTKEDLSV